MCDSIFFSRLNNRLNFVNLLRAKRLIRPSRSQTAKRVRGVSQRSAFSDHSLNHSCLRFQYQLLN
jgi:hypothetical protein